MAIQGSALRAVLLSWMAAGIAPGPAIKVSAAVESAAAVSLPGRISVRWIAASPDTNRAFVEVTGLGTSTLKELDRANWNSAQWQRLLAIHAEQGDVLTVIGLPPMLGTYRVTTNGLRFEPQFPLEAGIAYRATLQPAQLPGAKKPGASPISAVLQRPVRKTAPTTVVTQVYPSTNVVPENLLKFYIHFSAPMSGGHIYEHIRLLNDQDEPVELPFLEIDEELWNPDMTRLTVFIDPGRIKRGVQPLEEIGPALEEGKHYALVIAHEWKDSTGHPLKASFQKKLRIGPPDRDPPDPTRWNIQPPPSETREPMVVLFPEPMDHALAQRMIRVTDESGNVVDGKTALGDYERRWTFTPSRPWVRGGSYTLAVQTTIEDLAGNNVGKAFEVDVLEKIQRRLTNSTIKLPFQVR